MNSSPGGYFTLIESPLNEFKSAMIAFQNEVDATIFSVTGGASVTLADPGNDGIVVRTNPGITDVITLVPPSAGFTITNPTGVVSSAAANPTFVLANDLAALEGLSGTGYSKRTGTDAWSLSSTIPASDISSGAALTKTDDTNVTLSLGGSPSTALLTATSLTLGWSGTLAAARLNANVVQGVTNDTNVTGVISAQNLTLGWAGTLAVARGGIGVGTLASNGVLYGNGTGAVQALAVNSSVTNKFLTQSSSGAPAWATIVAGDLPGSFAGFANPTASVGLSTVNGSAATAMRSDGAPALDQSISPTWSGNHTFSNPVGFWGTSPSSTKGLYLNKTNMAESTFGIDINAGGDSFSSGFTSIYAGRFVVNSATSDTTPSHPGLIGLAGQTLFTGTGRVDSAIGVYAVSTQTTGSGFINDNYGVLASANNRATNAYALYGTISPGTATITKASGLKIIISAGGSGGVVTEARGIDLSSWTVAGGGTVTTSYGIYADTSIDVGSTKYFIYSLSASPSLITGALTLGSPLASTSGGTGVSNAGTLTNASNTAITGGGTLALGGFTLTVPATGTAVLTSRTLTAGNGLTGGGDLSADRTFTIGTPSTLTVSSTNTVSGTTHNHAITSSSNPGAAASILATDSSGYLTTVRLTATDYIFANAATANIYLKDTSTGFQSASTTVITPQSGNAIRSTSYTSGLVGWTINASGSAEFENVDIRGAIHAGIFVYNALAVTAGSQLITPSGGKLKTDVVVTASPTYGTTTFTVEIVDQEGITHAASQLFAVNDIIRLKDGAVGDTWFKVTAVSDQTTFWRYTASIQAGTANVTYRAGQGVPDYKQSGAGSILLTADQTNSPYIQMATHAGTFSSADASGSLVQTPQLRLGNLNGSYGNSGDIYGLGAGQYGTASKSWITVEQTNGFRIGNNTTTLAQWDTSGTILVGQTGASQSNIQISSGAINIRNNTTNAIVLSSAGVITVGQVAASQSNIIITSSALALRSNTTEFIRLNVNGSGYLANSSISWDTSGVLTVAGNASIAGWTVNSAYLAKDTGTNSTSSGMAPTDYPFFAGSTYANRATAVFRVTPAGALTATSATITGTITATAGAIGGFSLSSTTITSTGVTLTSGATASLAFGATVPTSATVGTGTYQDATGIFGLKSSKQTFILSATDGTLKLGSDIAGGASTTGLVLAGSAITYNSESLSASAILLGDNSSGKANVLMSGGSVKFRRGTTNYITLDATDAQFTNVINMSGASAALAIGATPPTSASAGSGIWVDRTGLYQLVSGNVRYQLDGNGVQLKTESSSYASLSFTSNFYTTSNYTTSCSINAKQDGSGNANVLMLSQGSAGSGGSGSVQFNAAKSDGSKDLRFDLFSGGATMYSQFYAASGTFAGLTVGANATPNAMLDIRGAIVSVISDTGTNALVDLQTATHNSSGVIVANFGGSMLFNLQSSTTADQNAARIGALWSTATHASRTSAFVIQTVNNAGSLAEVGRFAGNGDFTITGLIKAGSGPTTLTDSAGKVLAAALNTVTVAVGGTNKTSWTAGSIPYLTSTTAFAEDNANFFWDGTNHRLGIGTASPAQQLHVQGTTSTIVRIDASTNTGFSQMIFGENGVGALFEFINSASALTTRQNNFEIFNQTSTGKITFHVNNSSTPVMTIFSTGGINVGAPTDGDKGSGSINAVTVWRNGTSLDKVFEPNYKMLSIPEMKNFFETNHFLPTLRTDKVHIEGSTNIGALGDATWETVEVHARYIAQLHDEISQLKKQLHMN